MKVRIINHTKQGSYDWWYVDEIGNVFEVEKTDDQKYFTKTYGRIILKEDAEVVQEVEKICGTCDSGRIFKVNNPSFCPVICKDFASWLPIESLTSAKWSTVEETMEKLAEVGLSAPIVTNSQGGKQSKIATAFSLVPHDSLLAVAKVMKIGSERYEKDNWRKLSADEIYDHLMEHLVNWHLNGDMEELEHGITRAMMLYSVVNHD